MGDWTPSTPAQLPTEWRGRAVRTRTMTDPSSGIAMRFKGGFTLSELHAFTNRQAVYGYEILTALTPQTAQETVCFPSALSTGSQWNATNGPSLKDCVDDWIDTADFAATTQNFPLEFIGGIGTLDTTHRIVSVTLEAYVSSIYDYTPVTFQLRLNYAGTIIPKQFVVSAGYPSGVGTVCTATWNLDPRTGAPWTLFEANKLLTGAATWGCAFLSNNPWGAIVYSLRLRIRWGTEQRLAYAYASTSNALNGWQGIVMSAAPALTSNTWYYLLIWPPITPTTLAVPVIQYPEANIATSPSATVGEHRQVYEVKFGDFGLISTATATAGEVLPALFVQSGTAQSQSVPWTTATAITVSSGSPSPALGQEFTTSGSPPSYGAVKASVSWENTSFTPDAPLLFRLRQTSFTGTILATATLDPSAQTIGSPSDLQIAFDVPQTLSATTKYYLTIESAATAGRAWKIYALDSQSNLVGTAGIGGASTTTTALVEGQTFNGTTDAASLASSSRNTRYDLAVSVVSAPTASASITVTTVAGI